MRENLPETQPMYPYIIILNKELKMPWAKNVSKQYNATFTT